MISRVGITHASMCCPIAWQSMQMLEKGSTGRELLVDIKNRGLSAAPEIAVGPSHGLQANHC